MSTNFIFRVALRYFGAEKNNKLVSVISAFSLLGVTLGVAALIVVMSVMEGFHIELTSNMIGLGGDITITPYKGNIKNYDKIAKELKELEEIKSVIPQVQSKVLAISSKESSGVLVKGMNVGDLASKPQILSNQLAGDIAEIENGYNIALGKELAYNLGVRVGDTISIVCPETVSTMLGSLPRKKTFKIVSVFSTNMYDYDSATAIISLANAQKLFSIPSAVNYIEIYSNNPNSPISAAQKIAMMYKDNNFSVSTWYDSNSQFLNALRVERVAMFTILSLIIIVAAFNIISSLFMLVNEKRKDIAILRTMGASRKQILLIFVINGSLIGFIGTSLGVIFGIFLSTNIENVRIFLQKITGTQIFEAAIYFLYHLPSKLVPENVILIALMSFVLSVLATLYPSYKASSLDPSEALRNE